VNEKDRWSVHLEYLKIAIALATALIGAGAAIYVDASKIPIDNSRYVLLAGVGVFFVTLIGSVLSIAYLGNHLIYAPRTPAATPTGAPGSAPATTPTGAPGSTYARHAVWFANFSFYSLIAGAGLLGCFFAIRTFAGGGTSFERAIATGNVANRSIVDATKGESATLKSVEVQGDSYRLVFQISPGGGSITILTDSLGANVKSATRQ
jgi:hypothetical protein